MNQRSDGLTLIGIYHFVSGFLNLLIMGLFLTILMVVAIRAPVSGDPDDIIGAGVVAIIMLVVGGLFLLVGIANLVVGWGLWQRREWARISAMALAVLRLLNVPLGTLIGGLIIWYLLRPETKAELTA